MMTSIADSILMIRPAKFFSNPDTSKDNSFQNFSNEDLTLPAQQEFDQAVKLLTKAGIKVNVIQDSEIPETPDSIFPNNRLSFHRDGKVIIYSMMAANRREERLLETLSVLEKESIIRITSKTDYSHFEAKNKFLEGTGSMILDRKNKIVYVAISKRSDPDLVKLFTEEMDYKAVIFKAQVQTSKGYSAIYHTNVMLAIADDFVVIAESAIETKQRNLVLQSLALSGRTIITISTQQMNKFCGNILQLRSKQGEKIIVMSETAYNNFNPDQIAIINQNNTILKTSIPIIEKASGGSIRCMMAEIF